MRELGLSSWDIVAIWGKRKTAARALPLDHADGRRSVIELDPLTMENARVSESERVPVKKIGSTTAIKVVLAPVGTDPLYCTEDLQFLMRHIQGLPVTVGDRLSIPVSEKRREVVQVLGTVPADTVVIRSTTRIEIRNKPHERVPTSRVSYDEIGGLREQIRKVREMVEIPLKYPQIFERLGVDPPRGILLVGPPGSGKTLLARAVANETQANFQVVNGPEIIHKYYGESEAKLRAIFEEATRNQPSIIFLDELDAIAPKRGKVTGEVEKRVVAQLLALMDGLKDRGKVIVIGSTNLPKQLDLALRRPGRFDREIVLDVPDRNGRLEILKIHTRSMPLDEDVDLERIADLTHGFVGADLENLCRETAMKTLREAFPEIEHTSGPFPYEKLDTLTIKMKHFMAALREVEPSAIREIFVEIPKVTWDDVGGLKEIKELLIESVVWPFKYRHLYEETDTKAPKGVLLYGAPGTGKTLLAKALAHESGVNFISIKGGELFSKYVGESEQHVREVFRKAKQVAPSILFFDELDALTPSRDRVDHDNVSSRVISQVLTEIDGIEELNGVMILAATNRLEMVDSAILRAGRFDLLLHIPLPNEEELYEILKIHTRNKPLARNVKLREIARSLTGFSGAEVNLLCQRASVIAIREHIKRSRRRLTITEAHFRQALSEMRSRLGASTLPHPRHEHAVRTGNN